MTLKIHVSLIPNQQSLLSCNGCPAVLLPKFRNGPISYYYETRLIRDLQPSLNENEKLYLFNLMLFPLHADLLLHVFFVSLISYLFYI